MSEPFMIIIHFLKLHCNIKDNPELFEEVKYSRSLLLDYLFLTRLSAIIIINTIIMSTVRLSLHHFFQRYLRIISMPGKVSKNNGNSGAEEKFILQKNIRNNQINRAKKIIEQNPKKLSKAKQNDPKRFIKTTTYTDSGEIAENSAYSIDQSIIDEEAKYDGLYAV